MYYTICAVTRVYSRKAVIDIALLTIEPLFQFKLEYSYRITGPHELMTFCFA